MKRFAIGILLSLSLLGWENLLAHEGLQFITERLRRVKSFQQKEAILLTLDEPLVRAFLENPPLPLDELQAIPEATWATLIRRVPGQPIHPLILAAIDDDVKILVVFRTNPGLKHELKNTVPRSVWERIERLWQEHAQMIMASLGPLDGCSAVMKGLGVEGKGS